MLDVESFRPETSPESLTIIKGGWGFDTEFYQAMGIDMQILQDPAETSPIPTLRRRAFNLALIVSKDQGGLVERASQQLEKANATVRRLCSSREAAINELRGAVDPEHPAVVAYQERRKRALLELAATFEDTDSERAWSIKQEAAVPKSVDTIDMLHLMVVRRTNQDVFEIDEGHTYPYRLGITPTKDPFLNAIAATTARAAMHFDL